MAIRNFAKCLWAAALMAVACTVQEPMESQAPTSSEPEISNAGCVPGKAIVEFDDSMTAAIEEELAQGAGVSTKAMGSVIEQLGIVEMERVFPFAGEFEPRTRAMGLHHFYSVSYSEATPVTKAMTSLEAVPGVVSVTPSRPIAKRAIFNDPKFNKQWHYINSQYENADINVKGVWENYTKGSNKVVVCVVDEAVDPTHEDLKDNLWKDESGHTGYNYARGNYNMTVVNNDTGHGTHVAGTISAVNNNGKGLCGIAGGDKAAGVQGVLLMSHAIFSAENNANDSDTYRAIKEGADKGALISQNSWGYYADTDGDYVVSKQELEYYKSISEDPAMAAAVAYFVKNAGCDANGNQRSDSPMKGGLVIFASGNEAIDYDIVGSNDPNVIEVGAFRETGARASYSNYGDWVDIAAPGGEGDYDDDSIWSTIPTVVDSQGYGGQYWAGTSMACPHVSGVAALIISYFGQQGFTADDAKTILMAGATQTLGGNKPIGKKIDALASFQWALANQYTPGGTTPGPQENHEPSITVSPSTITIKAHESAVLSVSASDPDGDDLEFTLQDPGSNALTFDPATLNLKLSGAKAPAGTYKAVMKVTDIPSNTSLEPKSATANITYTILPNHAPAVAKYVSDIAQYGLKDISIDNADIFMDIDGETLKYTASVDNSSIAKVEIRGDKTVIAPMSYGVTKVTITAIDGLDAKVDVSFKVACANSQQPVTVESYQVTKELKLNIGSTEPVPVEIEVYNAAGAKVLRHSFTASVFDPILLDVSSLAPGRYTAIIKYGGKSLTIKFAKY